jgi:hypothetical protein
VPAVFRGTYGVHVVDDAGLDVIRARRIWVWRGCFGLLRHVFGSHEKLSERPGFAAPQSSGSFGAAARHKKMRTRCANGLLPELLSPEKTRVRQPHVYHNQSVVSRLPPCG